MSVLFVSAFTVLLAFIAQPAAFSQTALSMERVDVTLYVDGNARRASDSNPGSASRPFKTIGAAVTSANELNKQNSGVRIVVRPGIYREAIRIEKDDRSTDAPLIIEGSEAGKVIVSGAEMWTEWKRASDGLLTHPWPYKWGHAANPWSQWVVLQPIITRKEMIKIDGANLNQSLSKDNLGAGSFYVDEDAGIVYINPPEGTDRNRMTASVAVLDELLIVSHRNNIAIKNLVFTDAATALPGSAVLLAGINNLLVENCDFIGNGWSGLGVHGSTNVTLQNVRSSDNGGNGLDMSYCRNVVMENLETSRNNWRGYRGNFTSWSQAGYKVLHAHNLLLRNFRSIDNKSHGIWLDTDVIDMVIDAAQISGSEGMGVIVECIPGPIVFRNCEIVNNHGWGGFGMHSSSNVVVENCILAGNSKSQFSVSTYHINRPSDNHQTGEVVLLNDEFWTLRNNIIVANNPEDALFDIDCVTLDNFISTLKSCGNLFFSGSNERPFKISRVPLSLQEWQDFTRQDLTSRFHAPGFVDNRYGWDSLPPSSAYYTRAAWPVRELPEASPESRKEALNEMKRRQMDETWQNTYSLAGNASESAWKVLNLSGFANRALSGEQGWIGDGMPLEFMPTGRTTIQGVPFEIIDQESNDGYSAVIFDSNQARRITAEGRAPASEIRIDIGSRIKAFYVLHGAAYADDHVEVASYEFVYEDGTREVWPIRTYGKGSEHPDVAKMYELNSRVQDWWKTYRQFNNDDSKYVMILDRANPLLYERYIYTAQWVNPHVDKPVREVIVRASGPDRDPVYFLIAATALRAE